MDNKILITVIVGVLISLLAWELFLKGLVTKMIPPATLDEVSDLDED